eukprot:10305050-Prorocentrum_lima.AAC.1
MTSSLVGSEMCIRDSAICACEKDGEWEKAVELLARTADFKVGANIISSVSYTHLTLPTICSV